MVRFCGKDGCNERSVAEIISTEMFEGCREAKNPRMETIEYVIDLCPKHLDEL
jgi:hypothetical protein